MPANNPYGIKVGQRLYLRGVNIDRRQTYDRETRPEEVEVVKVGRKLLTIRRSGRDFVYRLDTLVINDDYGHESLQTFADYEAELGLPAKRRTFREAVGVHVDRFGSPVRIEGVPIRPVQEAQILDAVLAILKGRLA